jgi:L,D-transpeptidase catalytic domain
MKSNPALDRCVAVLAIAGLALLAVMGSFDWAGAQSRRDGKRDEFGPSRTAGAPLFAVVSLSDQRVTIYDANGKILQSPVSSGATGYETPAGIYSVVQKKAVHASNVYEDGNMPFMQRITWTGIALHAGVLPGQPASHGCVRLPYAFAQHLFDLTRYRPARDRGARRHPPERHRPPCSFQTEPGSPRGGPGYAARRPFVRQSKSWRGVVRKRILLLARLGQALADPEVDRRRQDRGSRSSGQEGRRSQTGGRKEGC